METAVDYMAASENQKTKEAAVDAYNRQQREIRLLRLPAPSQQLLERESRAKKIAVDLFLSRALFVEY